MKRTRAGQEPTEQEPENRSPSSLGFVICKTVTVASTEEAVAFIGRIIIIHSRKLQSSRCLQLVHETSVPECMLTFNGEYGLSPGSDSDIRHTHAHTHSTGFWLWLLDRMPRLSLREGVQILAFKALEYAAPLPHSPWEEPAVRGTEGGG